VNVVACSGLNVNSRLHKAAPKCRVPKPVNQEKLLEQDYGRNYMQLSYIIGMSMLGLASLFFATRGKGGLNIRA